MNDLRAAAQQALEALIIAWQQQPRWQITDSMHALRAALAQQAEPDAYGYASRLAVAIWEKHYKDAAPQWKPLDDLMGVLTQIDNMTSGLPRLAQQAEPVEPVAWVASKDGRVIYDDASTDDGLLRVSGDFENDEQRARYAQRIVDKLNAAPPQRLLLTEEEMYAVEEEARRCHRQSQRGVVGQQITYWDGLTPWLIRAVERAVWEKNYG